MDFAIISSFGGYLWGVKQQPKKKELWIGDASFSLDRYSVVAVEINYKEANFFWKFRGLLGL